MVSSDDLIKHLLDTSSIGLTIGTLADILPAISAFLAIVWILIRIWETDTVQETIEFLFENYVGSSPKKDVVVKEENDGDT